MQHFRKKPKMVLATQYQPGLEHGGVQFKRGKPFVVTAHDQPVFIEPGDWIIPEGKPGRFYPVKDAIFRATYEPVGDPEVQAIPHPVDGTPLPLYRSHKVVGALKIAAIEVHKNGAATISPADPGYSPFKTAAKWAERFTGGEGDLGYFVVYDDGFASWSPTRAFENGYTPASNGGDTA